MTAMNEYDKMRQVKENLRSVVESCKGGVPFKCLERDYNDLLGHSIPYKEMGYSSLEAMIADMSDTVKLERNNQNTLIARAVVTDATAHIASLVARQKVAKKPIVGRRRSIRPQSSRISQRHQVQASNKKFSLMKSPPPWEAYSWRHSPASTARMPLLPTPLYNSAGAVPRRVSSSSRPTPAFSPKQEYGIPPRFKNKESAKAFIDSYASAKNIVATYVTLPMGQRVTSFISTLTLNGHKYNSFPNEKRTREEAEEAAASIAKAALMKTEEAEEILPIAILNNTECISVLVHRIDEIVNENPSGIFSRAVYEAYKSKHREVLPDDWLKIIKRCTSEILESEGVTILYPRKQGTSQIATLPTLANESPDIPEDNKEFCNSQSVNAPMEQLPEDNFAVFVSCVVDSQNIAVRLVDYHYEFEELVLMMKEFYAKNYIPVKDVAQHSVCVTFNDGFWNRVLIEDIVSSTVVSCRYVDDGDLNDVNINDLQAIDPEFLKLPFQAVNLKLSGLEDISRLVSTENLVKYLLGNTLIAELVDRDEHSVILYDTSTDVDVNLNNTIKEITIVEALEFSLPKEGSTAIAHMSHVSECGEIYLHFKCHGNDPDLLQTELSGIAPELEMRSKSDCIVSKHAMYCAKYEDDCWYRAVILKELDNKVKVFYVDYGNTSWVSTTDICELSPVAKYLAEVPFQAVKCSLSELPPPRLYWHENAVNRFTELVPPEKEVIVKVEKAGAEINFPEVSLFLRNDDNVIISLNQTLAFSSELFSEIPLLADEVEIPREISNVRNSGISPEDQRKSASIGDKLSVFIPDVAVSAEEKLAQQQTTQSCRSPMSPGLSNDMLATLNEFPPLHPPDIPDVGNLFPITVSMAANPHNFMCQPYETSNDLDSLLERMNVFYSNEDNILEMHRWLIKEKHFYAGKHSDGLWYRVRVQNIVCEEPLCVSVYFVDYGDSAPLSQSNLQLLRRQFKTLPCQAMKASLFGIKPKDGDWNPEDCVRFRNRVSEKQFYAHVKCKEPFDDGTMECYKLELILIDTLTDPQKDMLIHQELINDGLALPSV